MTNRTIARAAREAGVHVETIRYYERAGIIERPRTTGTAYRTYPEETVRRVRFIKRAQKLGFSLREIRALLRLRAGKDGTSAAVRRRVEGKITDIEGKVRDLRAMRETLLDLLDTCSGRGGSERCPILRSLDGEMQDGAKNTPSTSTRRRTSWKSDK